MVQSWTIEPTEEVRRWVPEGEVAPPRLLGSMAKLRGNGFVIRLNFYIVPLIAEPTDEEKKGANSFKAGNKISG